MNNQSQSSSRNKLRVGINGFGRIGRTIFRSNILKNYFDIEAINDINGDSNNLAYLLKHDSTYGNLDANIEAFESNIICNGNKIPVFNKEYIDEVPWDTLGIDIIIDSSGVTANLQRAKKLSAGGIKCIVTNSPPETTNDREIVFGINHEELTETDMVISSSICDAVAFVPVMAVLDKHFGIEHGFLTTLHPWLAYQNLLDSSVPSYSHPGEFQHEYALGRASPNNLIPKPTSCISASTKIIRSLEGKFLSLSYRVPTSAVSSADVSVKLNKNTNTDDIIVLFKEEEKKQQYNIYKNNFEPLVSCDFMATDYSVVLDHRWTMMNDANYLKLVLWYDNEWSYSARVLDLVKYLEIFK